MKLITKFTLFSTFIFLSCNRENVRNISSLNQKKVYSIDLSNGADQYTLDLDSMIDITSIVKLKISENKNSVLVNYEKVLVKDSLVFALDREFKGLKVFTLKGDFVRMIGSIGQGPGEYTHLNDFRISNDTITILIDTQQLINYTIHGDYLTTLEIGRFANNFATNKKKFYFFMNYNVGSSDDVSYNLEITDKKFELIAHSAPFSENKGNVPSFGYTGFLQEKSGEIWFSEAFDNRIQVVKDTQLLDKYVFNFGTHGSLKTVIKWQFKFITLNNA